MRNPVCKLLLALALLLGVGGRSTQAAEGTSWVFEIEPILDLFPKSANSEAYVFFSKGNRGGNSPFAQTAEPRGGPDWFHPEPFLSVNVKNWEKGKPLVIDLANPETRVFPKGLKPADLVGLQAQAVLRLNPLEREVGEGPGNAYGRVVRLGQPGRVKLTVDRVVPEAAFAEGDWFKRLQFPSRLLSKFHGENRSLTAYVQLPGSYYQQPQKRYPVIFEIPGFGWTYPKLKHREPHPESNTLGVEFIRVLLDPNCRMGHHVFANSATNGPWMDALVEELIPELDRQFRTIGTAETRFLTGHSSGGWSSLWLQVNAPETFGGTWSTAPDPVDFRDFQRINVYRTNENMYVDANGQRRPLARMNGQTLLWYDTFCQMEDVLGDGGQLRSFEAVFSPVDADGSPKRLWNRETGAIDPEVAEAWKRYDIRLLLEENWPTLAPKLAGKIHVYMGTEDTFYLEGATQLLKDSLASLGSDAIVEMVPGRNHFDLLQGGLSQRIEQQMAERVLKVSRPVLRTR